MPPRVKTTEEDILRAAIQMIREKGIEAVKARELAKTIGCSVQPIFRSFASMEDLRKHLYERAEVIFHETMTCEVERHGIPFLGKNLAYVEFANEERNLYKFLYQSDEADQRSFFDRIAEQADEQEIGVVAGITGLNMQQSRRLFENTWLITHGLAALVAASPCVLGEEEVVKVLNVLVDCFLGMRDGLCKRKGELE